MAFPGQVQGLQALGLQLLWALVLFGWVGVGVGVGAIWDGMLGLELVILYDISKQVSKHSLESG